MEKKVCLWFSRRIKRTVHAPLAETFRKFEEWLERSGRRTKRADTTGLVCPAEVIVFLAARERTYSASKYTPRGWLTYSVLTGWRINTMVRSVTDFSTFRFLDTVCWNIPLTRSVVDLWITNCNEQKKFLYCLY